MLNKKNIKNLILNDINIPLVLLEDEVNFENIDTDFSNEYRYLTDSARKFVENNFIEECRKDIRLFNGDLYGIVNIDIYDNRISLTYEKTEYKYYLATKNPNYKKFIAEGNYFTTAIGTIHIIKTSDNKLFMGCKNNNKLGYKFTGGFVDNNDVQNEKLDLLHCAVRETNEELGNVPFISSKLIGVVKINTLTFTIFSETTLTSEDITNLYNKNKDKLRDSYEMDNMIFIDNNPKAIGNVMKQPDLLTKNSLESCKLYLKSEFSNYEYMEIK